MRKVLLSTTALVAAGLLVTSVAYADDEEMMEGPVTVGVGGYTTGAIGFASDSDDSTRGHGISYVYEIGVSGSTTLDNGITVAVSGQLGRSSGADNSTCATVDAMRDPAPCVDRTDFDEIHTTLSGSFGSLRLGRTESAAFNATVAAPGAGIGGMLGVNYYWFSTAGGGVNTYSGLGVEDALKVVYTTPNFNGLSIGLSYAPEDNDSSFAGRAVGPADPMTGHTGLGGHTAVGLTYSTDFMGGGSVSLGAGYETINNEAGGDDPSAMKFGINVGVDQLSFGGSMFDVDGGASSYDVGASWSEGATALGLQYANSDANNASMAAGHLTYTLGPGILVGAQIAAISADGADDVTQFMLGTAVFF